MVRLDFLNDVKDCTVPGFQDSDDFVFPLQIIRPAYQAVGFFLEAFDRDVRDTGFVKALDQVLAERVDGDAVDSSVGKFSGEKRLSSLVYARDQ